MWLFHVPCGRVALSPLVYKLRHRRSGTALNASLMSNRKTSSSRTVRLCAASVFASLSVVATADAATIYTWRDADGVQQYSDTCPAGAACAVMRIGAGASELTSGKAVQPAHDIAANSSAESETVTANESGNAKSGDASPEANTNQTRETISMGDASVTGGSGSDAQGTSVGLLLTWGNLVETNPAGYRVYYAPAGASFQPPGQGVNVGKATSYVITGVTSGARYYFKVSAYDASGNETVSSNTVYKDVP